MHEHYQFAIVLFLTLDVSVFLVSLDCFSEQASVQCKRKYAPNCFLIYGDNTILDSQLSVEEAKLFGLKKVLEFDDSCNIAESI